MKKTDQRNREKSVTEVTQQTGSNNTAIRPFQVPDVPEAELEELRKRINAPFTEAAFNRTFSGRRKRRSS